MFDIRVPIVVLVIGEGGSGGALGIGIGDTVAMMENAWYSVISPEGCASILWRSADGKEKAADALKLTAPDLLRLGIVDEVLPEPTGGAHNSPRETMESVGRRIVEWLDALDKLTPEELLERRFRKFRRIAMTEDLLRGLDDDGPPAARGEASLEGRRAATEAPRAAQAPARPSKDA
jgi:acetyl-CoA carboxylase carboxyl transferase subunit alpha